MWIYRSAGPLGARPRNGSTNGLPAVPIRNQIVRIKSSNGSLGSRVVHRGRRYGPPLHRRGNARSRALSAPPMDHS